MRLTEISAIFPSKMSAVFVLIADLLAVSAFPDIGLWYLAWVAVMPLLLALTRESGSLLRSFIAGWGFGVIFFFGTCWWLTFAPITYAGFPPLLAYSLLVLACGAVGVFTGLFGAGMALLIRRLGNPALLASPFIWVSIEFLRYWLTGNNWNAIGYSQAFASPLVSAASYGGVLLVSFLCIAINAVLAFFLLSRQRHRENVRQTWAGTFAVITSVILICAGGAFLWLTTAAALPHRTPEAIIVAIQPNVPMSGLNYLKWQELRKRHVELTENALSEPGEKKGGQFVRAGGSDGEKSPPLNDTPVTVIFPESPMNFEYAGDREFQSFIHDFARRNKVNVLFNSAEPNHADGKFFNSAVLVSKEGRAIGQYDKIHLMPFGEFVPGPIQGLVPALVGSFSFGNEYDLLPIGEVKAGVMICFESHFGELSNEYVRRGADVLIEMTNDGYLGPTPVLRQHLANAVFRAVETNRPVLRVTNVGITAFINERGEILDQAKPYGEDTRMWAVARSDAGQTLYVRYGDWFAWLCLGITFALLGLAIFYRRSFGERRLDDLSGKA